MKLADRAAHAGVSNHDLGDLLHFLGQRMPEHRTPGLALEDVVQRLLHEPKPVNRMALAVELCGRYAATAALIVNAAIEIRATEIANQVCGGRPQRCFGPNAKRWQAAWDGACIALGGNPEDYRPKGPATDAI